MVEALSTVNKSHRHLKDGARSFKRAVLGSTAFFVIIAILLLVFVATVRTRETKVSYWFGGPPVAGMPIILDGLAFQSIEVDLGDIPRHDGYFEIATTGKTPGKPVLVVKQIALYTGKGSNLDEAEMDLVNAQGWIIDANTIGVYWHSASLLQGFMKFNYLVSS